MTEPSPVRPIPGPPRPGPGSRPVDAPTGAQEADRPQPSPAEPSAPDAGPAGQHDAAFAELDRLPVAEHVAVFEAEHNRLRHELSTIDQL